VNLSTIANILHALVTTLQKYSYSTIGRCKFFFSSQKILIVLLSY